MEVKIFYPILIVFFLIQFLVVLGALVFVIFMARPEVPLAGYDLPEILTPTQKLEREVSSLGPPATLHELDPIGSASSRSRGGDQSERQWVLRSV